ncbi:hypothetical protein ACVWZM_001786 [Bradyrhizobium sp. USDA 4501]
MLITDADGLASIRTMFDERFRGRPITENDLLNAEKTRERDRRILAFWTF